ncbi:MAG: CPBP family intramembrane metalloprotease [Bacteroidales bacterium]|nr:CPBP family intramembrane metalloprotease [Bacteroidales bacterium]
MNKRLFNAYSWYLPGLGGMLGLFLMFLLGAVLGNIIALPLTLILPADSATDWVTVISYPIMFIPPMLYARKKSKEASIFNNGLAVDNNNFGRLGGFKMALVVSGMTIATAFAAEPISALLPEMPEWIEELLSGLTGGSVILSFISVSIFAPFFEEWLCRGVVLRGLLTKMRPASAIAVSAVFFAVLHMNPWQAIPAFILGLVFGYVYYKTGSLKLTMLMHFVNNTMALLLSRVPALEEAETFADIMSPWAYACVIAACVIFLAAAFITLRAIPMRSENATSNCDEVPSISVE